MTDSEFTLEFHPKLPQARTAELFSSQTHSVLDWRIKLTLKDGYIGLFLLCDGDQVQDVGWSCQVTASLTLQNFLEDKKNLSRSINHKLTDKDPDWGYHHFIRRSEVTTPGSGFLSTSGQLHCSATVVAAFPMYSLNTQHKPGGAGDSRKERGKRKAVVTGCGEGEGVVKTILRELVQDVVLWSVEEEEEELVVETSLEEDSTSSESERSDGEVSEEELEWLAKDLRNMVNIYSLTRGEGKTLKVSLKEVQEELVRQRRGVSRRRRPKERHLRPGYRVTEDDWGRRVRGHLSHKVLKEYREEEDPDFIPPYVEENLVPDNSQEDEMLNYFEESEVTFHFKNMEQTLDGEVLEFMKKEIEKNLIEMGRTHFEVDVAVQFLEVPVVPEKKMNPVAVFSKQEKYRDLGASEEKAAETCNASPDEGVTMQGQIYLESHEGVPAFPRVTLKPELVTIWEEEDEAVGTRALEGEENRGRKDTMKSVAGSSDGNCVVNGFKSNLLGIENKNIPEINHIREDSGFEPKLIHDKKVREVDCIKAPPAVMKALQGMDGAIRLLETAREELCKQAGLPGPPGGLKCYRAGCLTRAKLKCSRCFEVQYCSVQCTEMEREQHGLECRQLTLVKPSVIS